MFSFSYIWPLGLIVLSNIAYHICAKQTPGNINPFAALIITYGVGIIASLILYFTLSDTKNLAKEFSHINWAMIALGIAIVGLEVGNIYAYRVGWPISIQAIVQAAFLTIVLIFVGWLFYHESITLSKAAGIVICLVGLYFINR